MESFVRKNPVLAMAAANLMLGLNSVAAKIGFETIPTFLFSGFRYTAAGLIILYFARLAREHLKQKDYKSLMIQSGLQLVMTVSWYVGLTLTGAINTTILFLLTPIIVYVGSVLFLGEPRSNRALAGSLVAFCGGILMFGAPAFSNADSDVMIGNGLILIAASTLAAIILHAKRIVTDKNINTVLAYRWLLVGLFTFAVSGAIEDPAAIVDASVQSLAALLFGITFAGAFGIWLFYKSLEYMRAEDSSSLFYLDTLAGALGSVLILGERLTTAGVVAAGVIVAGVIISHPVHVNRYAYFLTTRHSRFEEFVRWFRSELDEVQSLVRKFF